MKVAIVTPTLSHFEVPLFRVAAQLHGIEAVVFHHDRSEGERYDSEYKTMIDWGEDLHSGYDGRHSPDHRSLRKAVRDWKPDVMILYGYAWKGALQILIDAKIQRVPVILRGLLSPYTDPRASLSSRLWRSVRPFLLRRFDAHHFGGSYGNEVLEEARVPVSKRYLVPFSVDTPYFARQAEAPDQLASARALRRDLGWSPDAPIMLFLCQHNWFKGPDIMIEIARIVQGAIPDAKLIMAGSGGMTDELKTMAATMLKPSSFHFPGYVSSKATARFYLAADLTAFPSRYDTWSRAVNEAMLCRSPCIVSHMVPACGGLVADGENGMVVQGLNPKDHAARIIDFFAMPAADRKAMGVRARARALTFSYDQHIDALRRSIEDRLA